MKATLKNKYDSSKNAATASLAVDTKLGDFELKASAADFCVAYGTSVSPSLSFSLGKPDSFSVEYSPPKVFKFQFKNSVKLLEKELVLTYAHEQEKNRTTVEGTVALDERNKIAVSNVLGTEEWKVRYTYGHGALQRTVMEPSYDVKANSWDFGVTRKFERGDAVKATYRPSTRALGLEWTGVIPFKSAIKISGSFNLEKIGVPKVTAETTWSYEI